MKEEPEAHGVILGFGPMGMINPHRKEG